MTKYDLHSHSTASDGALSPTELIIRAKAQAVTTLALTDHDTVSGIEEAMAVAKSMGINLMPGIELSTTWHKRCLHIVGLNINPHSTRLVEGIKNQQMIREKRAKAIGLKLEKKRITGAYEAVVKAANGGMITRSHFADFLLKENYVSRGQEAFDRYIGEGKPAYVATIWVELEEAIHWIKAAGGVAVIAHPLRYKMTATWMRRLLAEFKEIGGDGIEVITGRSSKDEIQLSYNYAKKFELAGSVGSDFHTPKNKWVELGRFSQLPEGIQPIWEYFNP
ncbi:MAG: PHP domain-containing protein [Methylococcales bacterium]|nr:PHP domain-containing protein [Methylococcales bacterium]